MTVIKMRKKAKPKPKHRRKKWYEKHHEQCMAIRREWDVKEGDGIKYMERLKNGSEIERELAKTYEKAARDGFWSMDYFDVAMAIYGSWHKKLSAIRADAQRKQVKLVKHDQ